MLRIQKTLGRSKHSSVCFVKSTTAGMFIQGRVTTTLHKKIAVSRDQVPPLHVFLFVSTYPWKFPQENVTLGKSGHTQKVVSPWATAIYPMENCSRNRT